MSEFENTVTPLTQIVSPLTQKAEVTLYIKRDDLIHPYVSGNKWRKLKYNLLEARKLGHQKLLTFGGAFSNHIYSTAAAGQLFGFKTVGIIRGEETLPLNPTLSFAREMGMEIHFMSRTEYREKESASVLEKLRKEHGSFYLVPEGGTNAFALAGVAELLKEIEVPFDYIVSAVGTGGTLSGLIKNLEPHQQAVGIAALAGEGYLEKEVSNLIERPLFNWEIVHNYHFGGYARINRELVVFMEDFRNQFNIPLDPVYTGKMMAGLMDLIGQGFFEKGKTIIALHTGGLQGIAGMQKKMDNLLAGC